MNQAILFNDDLTFDQKYKCWRLSGVVSGQLVTIFYQSMSLSRLDKIDNCTKYDLEEVAELWLEKNELEGSEIHIKMNQ